MATSEGVRRMKEIIKARERIHELEKAAKIQELRIETLERQVKELKLVQHRFGEVVRY